MTSVVNTRRADDSVLEVVSSQSFKKNKISLPSLSIDTVNIPSPFNPSASFKYNFYAMDERVAIPKQSDSKGRPLELDKLARYVYIEWSIPSLSEFQLNINSLHPPGPIHLIEDSHDKIVSEDQFFNPGYTSHAFSSIQEIVQGTVDVENYSKLTEDKEKSIFGMVKNQIKKTSDDSELMSNFSDACVKLSNFPIDSLGLRVYDESGKDIQEIVAYDDIIEKTRLHIHVNNCIIPDVFENLPEKILWENLSVLKNSYESVKKENTREGVGVSPVYNDFSKITSTNLSQPANIVGYVIERWRVAPTGNTREKVYYVEDPVRSNWEDREVLYGEKYIYSIKSIASVKLLVYSEDGSTVNSSVFFVSSRPVTVNCETFEYTPPPPPDDIKFTFDYVKRNLILSWDTPVNHQRDIKGFQVFRRKSIKEPFELIAQFCFDKSQISSNGKRYSTNERVDPNNIEKMKQEDKYLVHFSDNPVYSFTDKDFTVDTEFYVSSDYIYALCSVDAHGMISNYSSQHRVVFDPYKNRLLSKIICDGGSPKQYPNMNLRIDTFKDTIHAEGDQARQINLRFTPEYFKITDDRGLIHKIVEAQTVVSKPYYTLQLINVDNQKSQTIRININDPQNLTY